MIINLIHIKKTRKIALQSLYFLEFNKIEIKKLMFLLLKNKNNKKFNLDYFKSIIKNYNNNNKILNNLIFNNIEKNTIISILDTIIIKISLVEYIFINKLESKIIINEAIELSKQFSNKNNYMLVNKIINKIINVNKK